MVLRLLAGIILIGAVVRAQNIDLYLALLEQGRVGEVRDNLPELQSRYPNDVGVRYLQALTTLDGDSALVQFRDLVRDYPQSRYADDAAMRIGEYLYARGLYTQASLQLRSLLFVYPASEHLQRGMDLMVNSYFATGEVDSARHYLRLLKQKYPHLKYDQYGIPELDLQAREVKLVKLDQAQADRRIATAARQSSPPRPEPPREEARPWVIQVGAFGKYDNAKRLKQLLIQNGYQVKVEVVASHNRRLHAVRVVRYGAKGEANAVGRELQEKFGLDFRVIKRPE